jgi:hypothetical protein
MQVEPHPSQSFSLRESRAAVNAGLARRGKDLKHLVLLAPGLYAGGTLKDMGLKEIKDCCD